MNKIYRILDANVNRVSEGVRVLEDISRFYFENKKITANLRNFRHEVRNILAAFDYEMIKVRDSEHDIGVNISQKSNLDKKSSLKNLIFANFKRVTEGLRVLEESLKIIDKYTLGKEIEALRYKGYYIEKSLLQLLKPKIPKGLYGITSGNSSNEKTNIEVVEDMIKGGIKIIQYRSKNSSFKKKYEECKEIRKLTKKAGVTFIINDHIDLVLITDADGVHLGQDDIPVREARNILGDDKIIGLSTHSEKQAKKALELNVNYIGVGPIFKTPTKENYDPVGFEYLDYVQNNINIPYVAIGGINISNLKDVISKGAKRIAMVREISDAKDISQKIKEAEKIIKGE
ncbi:MAG: thiamine phosphate synthase [Fusobacteriota bacterium]